RAQVLRRIEIVAQVGDRPQVRGLLKHAILGLVRGGRRIGHGGLPSALVNDETLRVRENSRTEGARGVNSRGTTLLARKQDQLPGISRLLTAWEPPTRSYLTLVED